VRPTRYDRLSHFAFARNSIGLAAWLKRAILWPAIGLSVGCVGLGALGGMPGFFFPMLESRDADPCYNFDNYGKA
jgi:hypothetical protein